MKFQKISIGNQKYIVEQRAQASCAQSVEWKFAIEEFGIDNFELFGLLKLLSGEEKEFDENTLFEFHGKLNFARFEHSGENRRRKVIEILGELEKRGKSDTIKNTIRTSRSQVLKAILEGKDLGSDSAYIKSQIDNLDVKMRITQNLNISVNDTILEKVFAVIGGDISLLDELSDDDLKQGKTVQVLLEMLYKKQKNTLLSEAQNERLFKILEEKKQGLTSYILRKIYQKPLTTPTVKSWGKIEKNIAKFASKSEEIAFGILESLLNDRVHHNVYPYTYEMDIWIPSLKVNIEIDGPHHQKQKHKDAQRDKILSEDFGVTVIRIDLVGSTVNEFIETVKTTAMKLLEKIN